MRPSDVAPGPDTLPATAEALDPDALDAFAAALDAIYQRAMADVGEQDADYLRRLLQLQRRAELAGRAALQFGFLPPLWLAGTGLLCLSKVLENMEVGHNVLHGQYDFMADPALHGSRYEWDWSCPAEQWRHSHNYLHHTFTNVVGKDRDIGYGLLRLHPDQAWTPLTLLQPVYAVGLMLAFEAGVAVHDLELNRALTGRKPLREVGELGRPMLRKAARLLLKDYVLFPALAGVGAPWVVAGNLAANLGRNVWAFSVIFCGHFPDGVEMFAESSLSDESRGAWYRRQVAGSANIEGPRWLHVLSGHLSHQIEHHLFPDMPAWRYPQVADEVQAVCARYGVPYRSGPLGRQLATAWKRILRYTLPRRDHAAAETRPAAPAPERRRHPRAWRRALRRVA